MKKIISIIIVFILLVVSGWFYFYYGSVTTLNWIVTSKDVKKYNWHDLYLMYIKDKDNKTHTFKIEDNLAHFQYRSSDIYGSVESWDKVEVKSYWIRFPLFSKYRNIFQLKVLESSITQLEKSKNFIYFEKNNNIYKYNIEKKEIELYDSDIFNKKNKD